MTQAEKILKVIKELCKESGGGYYSDSEFCVVIDAYLNKEELLKKLNEENFNE